MNNSEGLYWCGKKGDPAIVRQLIDYGAEIDIWTASNLGLTDMVARLLDEGKAGVNETDNFFTPLHCAVQNNQIETAHYLISKGAALEARTISGHTPLRWAAGIIPGKLKSIEMINLLSDSGANLNSKDNWGNRPRDLMMWHRNKPADESKINK